MTEDKGTPHPKIITQVSVQPANTSDTTTIIDTIDGLEDKSLKPQTLAVDNGYDSDKNHQEYEKREVDLVCPPSGCIADGFGVMDFTHNSHNKTIIFFPMGQQCLENGLTHNVRKSFYTLIGQSAWFVILAMIAL